jgi:2-methylisocitrate lyase-like PEP mutase family enzyme
MTTQAQAAATFHSLHDAGLLLLPNCWDAGSATIMAAQGASALATSSAAVAWALGYGDGDKLPVPMLAACLAAITRNLQIPLTADIEGGYSDEPAQVGATVAAVIDAGVIGINLEDGHSPPALLARKIEAARTAAERAGVKLFINARSDVFLKGLVPPQQRVAETLARAGQYRSAGADGLFAAGARQSGDIAALAAGTPLALNILALSGVPKAAELATLGVRRLTSGSGIAESVYARVAQLTRDFLREGDGAALAADAIDYGQLNTLMSKG